LAAAFLGALTFQIAAEIEQHMSDLRVREAKVSSLSGPTTYLIHVDGNSFKLWQTELTQY
jgi:hypothetical protein